MARCAFLLSVECREQICGPCFDNGIQCSMQCVLPGGVEFYSEGPSATDEASHPRSYPIVLTGNFCVLSQLFGDLFPGAISFHMGWNCGFECGIFLYFSESVYLTICTKTNEYIPVNLLSQVGSFLKRNYLLRGAIDVITVFEEMK